ncbi:unnamed protein product [Linum tenue]|uniref:Uncharacterized protein n=1 Tax=Linum tenue TaxID=586396 RepID=A0AAV0IIA1_9ROSI|nr:unnamed protein product [Linum tenue]
MNPRCFVACWFGGQKMFATHYCWIASMASAVWSPCGFEVEMWMPFVDT